jgi:Fe-S cluster biogenesis protein NfuA
MVIENKDLLLKRIDAALNDIRPFLQVDGGNVEVIDVTDDMTVQIKWLGMCENCSMSAMTMKAGIEQAIKSRMPEIKSVVALNGMGLVV